MQSLAACLHDLVSLGPGGMAVLAGAMFTAGLVGSATHCALMCGPFVLTQVAADADRGFAGGRLERLSGAALLPYHLGRLLGYGTLGAVAGASSGLLAHGAGARALLAVPLGLAALVLLRVAFARFFSASLPAPAAPGWLQARLGSLLAAPQGRRGVLLGLLLSALPCGLLYAAVAGAAASGSALGGVLAMLAFVLGTVPALVGVGLLGRLFLRQAGPWLRPAATVMLVLNAALLAGLAIRLLA
jgi:sulfite exporter TauE/SafE